MWVWGYGELECFERARVLLDRLLVGVLAMGELRGLDSQPDGARDVSARCRLKGVMGEFRQVTLPRRPQAGLERFTGAPVKGDSLGDAQLLVQGLAGQRVGEGVVGARVLNQRPGVERFTDQLEEALPTSASSASSGPCRMVASTSAGNSRPTTAAARSI